MANEFLEWCRAYERCIIGIKLETTGGIRPFIVAGMDEEEPRGALNPNPKTDDNLMVKGQVITKDLSLKNKSIPFGKIKQEGVFVYPEARFYNMEEAAIYFQVDSSRQFRKGLVISQVKRHWATNKFQTYLSGKYPEAALAMEVVQSRPFPTLRSALAKLEAGTAISQAISKQWAVMVSDKFAVPVLSFKTNTAGFVESPDKISLLPNFAVWKDYLYKVSGVLPGLLPESNVKSTTTPPSGYAPPHKGYLIRDDDPWVDLRNLPLNALSSRLLEVQRRQETAIAQRLSAAEQELWRQRMEYIYYFIRYSHTADELRADLFLMRHFPLIAGEG